MEQTRNKEDAMRKNMRQNTEERTVQKSKTPFRLQKIDHWNFDSVWAKKNRYGDEEKKGKEEGSKQEWDQEQKREKKNELKPKEETQKRQWRKTQIRKHEMQKKERETLR